MGFTVALFVTSLSFDDAALTDAAKVGILFGSLIAGSIGYAILRTDRPAAERTVAPAEEPVGVSTLPETV